MVQSLAMFLISFFSSTNKHEKIYKSNTFLTIIYHLKKEFKTTIFIFYENAFFFFFLDGHNNVVSHKYMDIVFRRIDLAIHKGLAA
jgi:hypothetical protein